MALEFQRQVRWFQSLLLVLLEILCLKQLLELPAHGQEPLALYLVQSDNVFVVGFLASTEFG